MHRRRRLAIGWAALAVAGSLGAGCTALVGQFNVSDSADGGALDGTTDQAAGEAGAPEGSPGDAHPGDAEAGSCTAGGSCDVGPCQTGVVACDGGTPVCSVQSSTTNGTTCDAGAVCDNGACVACQVGSNCSEAGSCQAAAIACSSGAPLCTGSGNAPNGQSCGANLYCDDGTCAACTNGAPCAPTTKPCDNGSVSCVDGGLTCTDLGTSATPGTGCGTNQVCDGNGNCVACTAGNQCNPGGNLCETGTTTCSTGASTCGSVTNIGAGISCGSGKVCDGNGACIACSTGSACNPSGNLCQAGTTVCTSGTPVCGSLTSVGAGTSCGGGNVCDGSGHCVAVCSAANCAGGCCNPSTQACTLYASQTGTSCGHAGAQCHSCAVGTSSPACSTTSGTCGGTLIGQIAGYSDVIDIDSDGTNVYFVDAANSQIAQVSAYSLGTPVLLSAALPGVVSVVYDTASSLVVFDQQASSTTTALYKATPGVASSATKFATVNGIPGDNAIAVSSLGQVDALTTLSSTAAVAYTCTITGTCNPVSSNFASAFMNGVTWPANLTEPYWADQANGNIVTFVPSCGCYSNFATGVTAPAGPTNDGTYVYWMQVSGTVEIHRMAIAGGAVQNLGSLGDNNQVQNLSTDGKYIYWSAIVGGVGGIYYMPVAGGTPQLLTPANGGMPVRVHKENTTGQMVVYYGDTTNATVDKVIAPP